MITVSNGKYDKSRVFENQEEALTFAQKETENGATGVIIDSVYRGSVQYCEPEADNDRVWTVNVVYHDAR